MHRITMLYIIAARGRGLYVTRDFAPGEEIFVDEALISTTLSETRCDFCQKPLKVSTKIEYAYSDLVDE